MPVPDLGLIKAAGTQPFFFSGTRLGSIPGRGASRVRSIGGTSMELIRVVVVGEVVVVETKPKVNVV